MYPIQCTSRLHLRRPAGPEIRYWLFQPTDSLPPGHQLRCPPVSTNSIRVALVCKHGIAVRSCRAPGSCCSGADRLQVSEHQIAGRQSTASHAHAELSSFLSYSLFSFPPVPTACGGAQNWSRASTIDLGSHGNLGTPGCREAPRVWPWCRRLAPPTTGTAVTDSWTFGKNVSRNRSDAA